LAEKFFIGAQAQPQQKKKLMWVAPSPLMQASFGGVSHELLSRLDSYDILYLGQNYYGSPRRMGNYTLASYANGAQLLYWINLFKPDITIMYQSQPYLSLFNSMAHIIGEKTKLVLYIPVESTPCQSDITPFIKETKLFIVPSYWSQTCLKKQYSLDSEVLYHGVDMGMFQPRPKPETFSIGSISSHVWRKQLTRMVDAHQIAEQKGFQIPCLFVTSTYDASPWLPDLQSYIAQIKSTVKLSDAAYMNLALGQPDVAVFYNRMHVHMLPSTEAFGLPNVEAMASGTVPLVIDHGANAEVVGECGLYAKVTGYLDITIGKVALVDVEDLAEKIVWAKTNPEKLKQLSDKGLERAKIFNWEAAEQKLERILAKL
jgi:glycosyltransferase involved in cell wall biosynthesis